MPKENETNNTTSITNEDEVANSINDMQNMVDDLQSEITNEPKIVKIKVKKRYFDIYFDVDDEEYFKDKEVTLKFQQVKGKRFRIIIKDEKMANEIVRHITDNFKLKDINLYNRIIGAIA
ncbi:hypothetical protein Zmor_016312 [Zophobas morio]|uniref:Uncharacterized protein n=1 Tax=Zophobas morio TaxID=2755281 RepID=A0AA38HG71_9CUCU|nr:hypothetical protein Zmor_016312 [Zophobas morio]